VLKYSSLHPLAFINGLGRFPAVQDILENSNP
jgi:hypothetical protein